MRHTKKLREIVARREAVTTPGAANALFARIIEDIGFEVAYVSGAGIANMKLGAPDIGLTTISEVADTVASIADAVDIPLVVDADTGFGNALNMRRTVRMLERAGAAGIQIEDQVFPKKCGHFSGKEVIPVAEMVEKIRAAVDARIDDNLMIIARTDARAVEGFAQAIERGQAFVDAGADMIFIEAPVNFKELSEVPKHFAVPQVANIVFGGKTPDPGREALAKMGYSLVLYANASLQAALQASHDVLSSLRETGSLKAVEHKLASFDQRQRAVHKESWDALEQRYRVGSARIKS